MLKIIGLSFVFFCTSGMGFYNSYKTTETLKQLKDMINFMYYIKQQIEYFNTPLDDIYDSFLPTSEFLVDLVSEIAKDGWNNAIEKTNNLSLPPETLQIIKEYGNILGKSPKEEQLSGCDYYIQALEKEYKNIKSKAPDKIKRSIALGLSTGLMLVILFI